MTLDEAIKRAEEVAEKKKTQAWEAQLQEEYEKSKSCKKCAEEHRQLAEWLKELKQLREQADGDLISRDYIIQQIQKAKENNYNFNYNTLIDFIKVLPSAEKMAEWITK